MYKHNEIIKLNQMEFQFLYKMIINYLQSQTKPKKGFRTGHIPDQFIIHQHEDQIKNQLAFFAINHKYGSNFDTNKMSFTINNMNFQNQEYLFDITIMCEDEELLKKLTIKEAPVVEEEKLENHEEHKNEEVAKDTTKTKKKKTTKNDTE